jgi:beta-lactamase regulating signal transducer with metallopeptidase domain
MSLNPLIVQALGWTLLHFLWQGAALAAVFASLNWALRHASPPARYALAAATLVGMLALPVATLHSLAARPLSAAEIEPSCAASELPGCSGPVLFLPSRFPASVPEPTRQQLQQSLPALVSLWAAGVLLLSLRTFGGWALVQRLKVKGLSPVPESLLATFARLRDALRIAAPVRLYQSALVRVPTALGWLRPVVLVPAGALVGLSASQLELVLAHELAHIRRRDYLVNLLQTAVETLLFYHPAVWWVSHRMRVEREHCCDDLAIAACGNPVGYARALADLESLGTRGPVLAMAASGGSLFDRVARLVAPPGPLSRTSRGLATVLGAGALVLVFAVGSSLLGVPRPAGDVSAAEPAQENPTSSEVTSPRNPKPPREDAAAAAEGESDVAYPLSKILEMANAGMTPEYIDEMEALGYTSLTADQLLTLCSHGVDPDFIRGLTTLGYTDLTPEQLVSLRSQGVDPEQVEALKKQGLDKLSLSDLLSLQSQGVDADFIEELKKAGYQDLSVAQLITLRSQGVDGEFATGLKELGYTDLSTSKLIALRSQGVDPDFVRQMAELGYRDLSVPMLLALRGQGVDPDEVRELKELGYADLPAGTLVEMRGAGVDASFVREMKDAGFDKLTPAELIQLRHGGVTGELAKRLKGRL